MEKRIGTQLRNAKKEHKGGKKQEKQKDKVIKNLKSYYSLQKVHFIGTYEEAIWAIFYHKISSNDESQHVYCIHAGEDF